MHQVRTEAGFGHLLDVLLGGLLSPCFDAYRPNLGLSAQAALDFHAWQAEELAQAGAEYLMAATLPALEEAMGMAQIMTRTQVPSVISFVTNFFHFLEIALIRKTLPSSWSVKR
jgi:S-methylmethionine-dependent homocysteine/selenocysteine methylase